jgi:hypothetical protein
MDDNPLLDVAPGGPAAVLDGAFSLLRFRVGRLVGLTALVLLPVQAVFLTVRLTVARGAVVTGDQADPFGLGGFGTAQSDSQLVVAVIELALTALALCWIGLGVGHLVVNWWGGRDPSFRETLGVMVRRVWVVPVVVVITTGIKVPFACLGLVGYFLADAVLFIAGIVAGAERTGPFATVGRSLRLTWPVYGSALVTCLGGFLITYIIQFVLTLGPLALLASFGVPEGWLIVAQEAAALVALVTVPLTACIAARAYVEFRCRVEGVDLIRRQEARGLR